MNLRFVMAACATAVCAACIWAVIAQQNALASLRSQRDDALARLAVTGPSPAPALEPIPQVQAAGPASPELLKARNEVTRLTTLKRQLSGLEKEHAALEAQLAKAGTNTAGKIALPEGYIMRKNARMLGFNSPENTIQTFLWAIENGDPATLTRALTPEAAQEFENGLQRARDSGEDVLKQMKALPGFAINGRKQVDATTVELQVTIMPDIASQTMRLQLIGGEWKMRPF